MSRMNNKIEINPKFVCINHINWDAYNMAMSIKIPKVNLKNGDSQPHMTKSG